MSLNYPFEFSKKNTRIFYLPFLFFIFLHIRNVPITNKPIKTAEQIIADIHITLEPLSCVDPSEILRTIGKRIICMFLNVHQTF